MTNTMVEEKKYQIWGDNGNLLKDFNLSMDTKNDCIALRIVGVEELLDMHVSGRKAGEKSIMSKEIALSEVVDTGRLISVEDSGAIVGIKLKNHPDFGVIISRIVWIIGTSSLTAEVMQENGLRLDICYRIDGIPQSCSILDQGKTIAISPKGDKKVFEYGLTNNEVSQSIRNIPHFPAITGYFKWIYPSLEGISTLLLSEREIVKLADIENRYQKNCYSVTYDEISDSRKLITRREKIENRYRTLSDLADRTPQQEKVLEKCAENMKMYYKELYKGYDKEQLQLIIDHAPNTVIGEIAKEALNAHALEPVAVFKKDEDRS